MTTELNTNTTTMLSMEEPANTITYAELEAKKEAELLAEMLDFSKMKKKPRKKTKSVEITIPTESVQTDVHIDMDIAPSVEEPAFNYGLEYHPPNYHYQALLGRLYAHMPQQRQQQRKRLPQQPIITKAGKKTHWSNIYHCASSIGRKMEHLQQFVLAELSATGTVNGSYSLIISGRYDQPKIEFIYKKYIAQYVQCENCRGLDSNLEKDSISSLPTMKCNNCGSDRRVAEISGGYRATTKVDRKKSRQQS
uniref:Translation initiation factor IF2/IF5 domain-containing protein n=1 Tax=viral metagenome TaxID=1070528 RepID=A0A6C0HIF1_9ZZZZ